MIHSTMDLSVTGLRDKRRFRSKSQIFPILPCI